jgi:hypothetical protein
VTASTNAARSGEGGPLFQARQIVIGGTSVTGDVGDAGLDEGAGDGGGHEADRPAGRDVLELLLEVVDRRSGTGLPAVGAWVDVVEGLPAGGGAALDDDGIVGEVGNGDLVFAGGRMADREDGDARL